jgi:ketosteroid isomerase-like protein
MKSSGGNVMTTRLCSLALLVLGATLVPTGNDARAEQGTAPLRKVVMQFYAALNTMLAGDAGPMVKLWSRRPDVTYMGPDGNFWHGWIEIDADFAAAAAKKLGGSVEPKDITITVGHDLAVVVDIENGRRTVNGKLLTNSLRATSFFRLEGGQWKMIGHHVDPNPAMAK